MLRYTYIALFLYLRTCRCPGTSSFLFNVSNVSIVGVTGGRTVQTHAKVKSVKSNTWYKQFLTFSVQDFRAGGPPFQLQGLHHWRDLKPILIYMKVCFLSCGFYIRYNIFIFIVFLGGWGEVFLWEEKNMVFRCSGDKNTSKKSVCNWMGNYAYFFINVNNKYV